MGERITVYKLKPKDRPFYKLEWVEPGTDIRRSRSAKTASEKDAERQRADLEYELNNGKYAQASRMSWEEFREAFLEEHAGGLRERSKEKYASVLGVFEELCKPAKLSGVDERMLSRFVKGMRERKLPGGKVGAAPYTIKNYLVALHKVLVWAKEQKLIAEVPGFPRVKVPKTMPQPVSKHEFARLLRQVPDVRWQVFLLCAWYAGLRLSEVRQLRRKPSADRPWVDWAQQRIVLPAAFVKAGEDQWVPLHPVLQVMLGKVPAGGDELFPFMNRHTGLPLERSSLSNKVIYFARKAGVKLSMHRLRKGFGCRVAQQLGKGNAPVLHRLMRHKSMQITMDYYASVDDVLHDTMKELK